LTPWLPTATFPVSLLVRYKNNFVKRGSAKCAALQRRIPLDERRFSVINWFHIICKKSKDIPRQAEVGQGVPSRLRPRIFSTFGTTRVVGRRPKAPTAFTPGEIPGTHFQRLSRPQGTWFCLKEPRKKSQVTPPGIDPGTYPTSSPAP
jgi:hypothetical protein